MNQEIFSKLEELCKEEEQSQERLDSLVSKNPQEIESILSQNIQSKQPQAIDTAKQPPQIPQCTSPIQQDTLVETFLNSISEKSRASKTLFLAKSLALFLGISVITCAGYVKFQDYKYETLVRPLNDQVLTCIDKEDYKKALEISDKAIQMMDDTRLYAHRAFAKYKLGEYQSAYDSASKVIEHDEYSRFGKFMIKALNMEDWYARAYFARGLATEKIGKKDDAFLDFFCSFKFNEKLNFYGIQIELYSEETTMDGEVLHRFKVAPQ